MQKVSLLYMSNLMHYKSKQFPLLSGKDIDDIDER